MYKTVALFGREVIIKKIFILLFQENDLCLMGGGLRAAWRLVANLH